MTGPVPLDRGLDAGVALPGTAGGAASAAARTPNALRARPGAGGKVRGAAVRRGHRIAWVRLLLGGGSEDAARAHELLEQARSTAKALDADGIEQDAAALLEGAGTTATS